jgi:hypothetical protein
LARIDAMIQTAPRKELWLQRKADILEAANRRPEAVETYLELLKTVEALPPGQRQSPGIVELETKARAKMRTLEAKP